MLSLIALWIQARPLASSVTNDEENHFCFYAHSKQDRTNWLSKCLAQFLPNNENKRNKEMTHENIYASISIFCICIVLLGLCEFSLKETKKSYEISLTNHILSETSMLAMEKCAFTILIHTQTRYVSFAFGEQWNSKFQMIEYWSTVAYNVRINEHKIAAICRYSLKLHFIYRKRLVYYPSFTFYSYL